LQRKVSPIAEEGIPYCRARYPLLQTYKNVYGQDRTAIKPILDPGEVNNPVGVPGLSQEDFGAENS
jgi:hypothetical protein